MAKYNPLLETESSSNSKYNPLLENVSSSEIQRIASENVVAQNRERQRLAEEERKRREEEARRNKETKSVLAKKTESKYEKSFDSPKNFIESANLYANAYVRDPLGNLGNIARGLLTEDRARKLRGNTLILERRKDISSLDSGDQNTEVDHKIPLALGGSNAYTNLQIISKEDNKRKSEYEKELMGLLENKKINKSEAKKRMTEFNKSIQAKEVGKDTSFVGQLEEVPGAISEQVKQVPGFIKDLKIDRPLTDIVKPEKGLLSISKSGRSINQGVASFFASSPQWMAGLVKSNVENTRVGIPIGWDAIRMKPMFTIPVLDKKTEQQAQKIITDKIQEFQNRNQKAVQDKGLTQDQAENKLGFGIGSGAASMVTAMTLAAVTKSSAIPASVFGYMKKGDMYNTARELGVEPWKAETISDMAGLTETVLEKFGLDMLTEKIPLGNSKIGNFIANSVLKSFTEGSQEFSQEVGSNAWEMTFNKERRLLDNAIESGFIGSIMGLAGGGAGSEIETKDNIFDLLIKSGFNKPQALVRSQQIVDNLQKNLNPEVVNNIESSEDPFANVSPSELIEFPTEPIVTPSTKTSTEPVVTPTTRVEMPTEPIVVTPQTKEIKTLYHGENNNVTETKKQYNKVKEFPNSQIEVMQEMASNGDQRAKDILGGLNKYIEADKYLAEVYKDYDAIKYNNQNREQVGPEYYDINDGKFYAENKDTASVYARQNRDVKYQESPETTNVAQYESPNTMTKDQIKGDRYYPKDETDDSYLIAKDGDIVVDDEGKMFEVTAGNEKYLNEADHVRSTNMGYIRYREAGDWNKASETGDYIGYTNEINGLRKATPEEITKFKELDKGVKKKDVSEEYRKKTNKEFKEREKGKPVLKNKINIPTNKNNVAKKSKTSVKKLLTPKKSQNIVASIISGRSSLDILKNAKTDGKKIIATDLEHFVIYNGKVDLGKRLIPKDALKSLNPEELKNVKSSEDINDFPIIEDKTESKGILGDSQELSDVFSKSLLAIPKGEDRPVLSSIHLMAKNGILTTTVTDSYRLNSYQTPTKANDFEILIPSGPAKTIAKILKESGGKVEIFTIEEGEIGNVKIKAGDFEVLSRTNFGQYPNYEQIMPEKIEKSYTFDKNELIDVLKKNKGVAFTSEFDISKDGKSVTVRIRLTEDSQNFDYEKKINLKEVKSNMSQDMVLVMPLREGGDALSVSSKFMIDALNSVNEPVIGINSAKYSPIIVNEKGSPDRIMVQKKVEDGKVEGMVINGESFQLLGELGMSKTDMGRAGYLNRLITGKNAPHLFDKNTIPDSILEALARDEAELSNFHGFHYRGAIYLADRRSVNLESHELGHFTYSYIYTDSERKMIRDLSPKKDEQSVREWHSEQFGDFVSEWVYKNKPELMKWNEKLVTLFKTAIRRITEIFKKESPLRPYFDSIMKGSLRDRDLVEKGYLKEKTGIKPFTRRSLSFSSSAKTLANNLTSDPFSGFSDITTTVLNDLVGKTSVSQQYILDQLNRPGVKQAEKDIVNNVLGQFTERVNVKEFADAVRTELLPLDGYTYDGSWENIVLPDDKIGKVQQYSETIYQSPVKTSAGKHHYDADPYGMPGETEEAFPNYFAHVRKEDMAESGFGTIAPDSYVRRILEIQSDLFQRGRLEREYQNTGIDKAYARGSNYATRSREEIDGIYNDYVEKLKNSKDEIAINFYKKEISELKYIKKKFEERSVEVKPLEPYRNTWHERVIREEIKKAANDKRIYLRFPTGKTAILIEGLNRNNFWNNGSIIEDLKSELKEEYLIVGNTINDGGKDWVILKDNGEGSFNAIPKYALSSIEDSSTKNLNEIRAKGNGVIKLDNGYYYEYLKNYSETFYIPGKVDINNPIYKFYESEVFKYLNKIRPDLQRITDENGVEWFETKLTEKDRTEPVIAFSRKLFAKKKENALIVRRSEIVKDLSEKLNVPIRTGKIRGRALGIFKERPEVIRSKKFGDISTIAHEVGHLLDKKLFGMSRMKGGLQNLPNAYKQELYKQATIPNASSNKTMEGFAEYLSRYISDPEKLTTQFPLFHPWFDSQLSKFPEIKDVLLSAREDYTRWKEQPAVAKILSQISQNPEKNNRISLDRIYTLSVDELNPIKKFVDQVEKTTGQKISITNNPYILARLNRGWAARAEVFLQNQTFNHNFQKTGESFSDIMKEIEDSNKVDVFDAYLISRRVIALKNQNRNIQTGVSIDDANETIRTLEEENPHFKDIAERLYAFNDRLLDYAMESGLLTKELYNALKVEGLDYVPLFRVMDDMSHAGKRLSGVVSPIKKLKGSTREIISPTESIVKNVYAIINASDRNIVSRTFADIADKSEGIGGMIEKIPNPLSKVATVTANELGVDLVDSQTGEFLDSDQVFNIFRPQLNVNEPNIISVLRQGKPTYYEVDPDLYNALMNLDQEQTNLFMRILSVPAKLLRAGATLTPDFSLRNPMRDQFAAMVFSNYGFIPGYDLIKGIASVLKQDENYLLWKMAGGEHSMLVSMDREHLQKTRDEAIKNNLLEHVAKNPIDALRMLSEFGESGTRVGEFKKGIAKDSSKEDILKAAMSSREITLDFARIGAKTRAINAIQAFWNAQVQDIDKIVREFKNNPVRMNMKAILGITLPTILLYMINRDDDRYKELPEWQKASFWIIPTPNFLIRLPKPFTLGFIYSTIPEAIMRFLDKNDPKGFKTVAKSLLSMGSDLLPINPTALQPIIENITNYSFFQQRSLVPASETELLPEDQYGPYTSELSKLIGKITNTSPRKVANLIQGYGGGLGKYAESSLSKLIGLFTKPPSRPSELADVPILKAFISREPVGSNSETVANFYEDLNKASFIYKTVSNRVKNGREVSARDLLRDEKNLKLYQNYLPMNRASMDLSDVKKDIERTLNSDMSKSEKKAKIREYDLKLMDIARRWKEGQKDSDLKSVDEIIISIKKKNGME